MTDFNFSKYKVLLCDMDPKVIDVVRTTYMDAEIGDFVATPSPKEALTYLPEMKPDLILVALDLPNTTGIEVIQKIRSLEDGAFYKTPILMLMDKVSQNLLREACRAGIEGALRKPISPEKVKRFSRAVILKPRRFICVRHYFGPERRMRSDPHFNGEDRRSSFREEELTTDAFTRNRPAAPASESSSGGFIGTSLPESQNATTGTPDWTAGTPRARAEETTVDYGSLTSQSSDQQSGNGDYDLTSGPEIPDSAKEVRDYDLTSETKDTPSTTDYDFSSEDKADSKETDIEAVKEGKDKDKDKSKNEIETISEVVETGPDDDDFEEIIDLEECLELHKQWINSGGKGGQQAKRPHSDFRGKELAEADFTQASLPQSNFEGVNCTSTVFRKSDLSGSTFKHALMMSADMRVTRLNKADLRNARLDRANFLGADLSGANLEGATLRSVNLSGANLHLTNLRGVNLTSAQGLIPEQIKRAITDQSTRLPLSARTAS